VKPERIYLDWNATTPLRAEARAAMTAAFEIGNPSSVHSEGRKARAVVELARGQVAAAVGARPQDVIFTSGGTEANALALAPCIRNGTENVEGLLISSI
jgi:cysteine desulfurase